ncbi:LPXTG cell wall anchor domain-containing protein [Agrococcus citreus]|uniref:Gram-positive cocci surface proteins LPxTG domain-containing protein n=1 Tax=Agrococcus citreus TaxID=84643 RepID=A0ABN1YX09_9MICO
MRWLLVPLAALLLVLVPVHPAAADEGDLDFAVDGSAWSSSPTALLPEAPVLAPGESVAPTLEMRSMRDEPVTLVVAVIRPRASDPAASAAFSLAADDERGRALLERTPFEGLSECTVVMSRLMLPGETAAVTVAVALDAALTGTEAQGSSVGFDLRVGMAAGVVPPGCPAEAVDIPFVPASPESAAGATLPQTGAPLAPGLVIGATAMMVLGAALVAARRREDLA